MSCFSDADYVAARRKLVELREEAHRLGAQRSKVSELGQPCRARDEDPGDGSAEGGESMNQHDRLAAHAMEQVAELLTRATTTVRQTGMRRAAEHTLLEQLALIEKVFKRGVDAQAEARRLEAHRTTDRIARLEIQRVADVEAAETRARSACMQACRAAVHTADHVAARTACETAIALDIERERAREKLKAEAARGSQALAAAETEARDAARRCQDTERRCRADLDNTIAALKAEYAAQRDTAVATARAAAAKAAAAADAALAESQAARAERDAAMKAREADAKAHSAQRASWQAKLDAELQALDSKIRRLLAARDHRIQQLQAELCNTKRDRDRCHAMLTELDTSLSTAIQPTTSAAQVLN